MNAFSKSSVKFLSIWCKTSGKTKTTEHFKILNVWETIVKDFIKGFIKKKTGW